MKITNLVLSGVFISAIFLQGCTDELKKKAPIVDPRVKQLSFEQVQVSVSGLEKPNQYKVEFSWPNAQGTVRVREQSKILGVVPGSSMSLTQVPVDGGSELSYLIEHLSDEGRVISSLPLTVKVPKDIFWDSSFSLNDHLKVEANRIFISPNGVITTNDKNLTIITQEFIADGGVIQSFPEGAAAFWEKNGRNGGTITIIAEKAHGTLQVSLRGEAGGHGKNGCITAPGQHPGCAGTTGGNGGTAGNLNVSIVDGHDLNISYQNQEGALGQAGVRGSVPYGTPDAVYPPCDRDAPNGVDGVSGGKGQVCLKLSKEEPYACQ